MKYSTPVKEISKTKKEGKKRQNEKKKKKPKTTKNEEIFLSWFQQAYCLVERIQRKLEEHKKPFHVQEKTA
jgi:hypothetical protein